MASGALRPTDARACALAFAVAVAVATSVPALGCRGSAARSRPERRVTPVATWGGLIVRTAGERKHPRQVVVLLHGWGAPGADLVPLAGELSAPGRLFVFPEAPLASPGGGRAWWPLDMAALEEARLGGRDRDLRRHIPEGMAEARARVLALLDEAERQTSLPRSAFVLGGFSQGAMLALDASLASRPRPGAIVVMSGTLVSEAEWTAELANMKPLVPMFMSHGRADPVLPFRLGLALRDLASAAGHPVTWVPFDGGHGIPPSVMTALAGFLDRARPQVD